MKNRPIHENLDTSFVNLSALIKYLRRRQFAGQVRVELSGYEADIYLTSENRLKVREYDHIAGRIAEGEEALQRILIRAREPGGIINVYQTVAETESVEKVERVEQAERREERIEKHEPPVVAPPVAPPPVPVVRHPPLVEAQSANGANGSNGANGHAKIELPANGHGANGHAVVVPPAEEHHAPPKPLLPNLPFEFTNRVEDRAKQPALTDEDRELLLKLTGELLGTIDHALAMAKLDFTSAFRKACHELVTDYPFLATLDYGKGKIHYAERTNPKVFVAGILEAVRRNLEKLGHNPKFAEVYRYTTQRILALIHQRKPFYDKFSITKPLEKILGT
ncbi:MAG: hypothetical protein JSS81_24560 [Acidobacteria bacterium]|nr:hypothetical protein [Acidobacteriota bacterium]